jgi:hypothetical protein
MIVRVTELGRVAFQLRKGEEGLSVFDTDAVEPPLSDAEILESFRVGSRAVSRSRTEIESKGLQIVPMPGVGPLSPRLCEAHAEIRPGPNMARPDFKQALRELE